MCQSYGDQADDPMGPCDLGAPAVCTGMCRLIWSKHSAEAGVKPGGPENEGTPLWTATTAGYTPAVERLARCGAPLDNLVFAAVAGDLALV